MAKQVRTYSTILDEISAMMEKEGDIAYHAVFQDSTVKFGIKGWSEAQKTSVSQANWQSTDQSTFKDKQPPPDAQQFDKANKQLQLKASSTIQSAAYWPKKQYLLVSFKSGHTYSYQGVGQTVLEYWEGAASAGSFFYYNIRTSYPYQKVG